jgi:hypothetical protein
MRKGLLVGGGACGIFLILLGLRWNSAPFFSVPRHCCLQTGSLSQDYFASVDDCVKQLVHDSCSAHRIIDQLKKQFPILTRISVAYLPTAVHVKVNCQKPVCRINNSLVLTEKHELFSRDIFSKKSLEYIPTLTVAQDCLPKAQLLLPVLLKELSADLDKAYNCELINEHCVQFTSKDDDQFVIFASVEQKKISSMLVQCATVKKNISERKGFDKNLKWIADTRFADYIVAYKV